MSESERDRKVGTMTTGLFISDTDAHHEIHRAINEVNFQIGQLMRRRSVLERALNALAKQATK